MEPKKEYLTIEEMYEDGVKKFFVIMHKLFMVGIVISLFTWLTNKSMGMENIARLWGWFLICNILLFIIFTFAIGRIQAVEEHKALKLKKEEESKRRKVNDSNETHTH